MANLNNSGSVTGRLAADPVSCINADGSKKVMLTIHADRNFRNSEGQRDIDRISLETFVRAETEGLGVFGHMHKGDLVTLGYTVRSGSYADKATGEVIYSPTRPSSLTSTTTAKELTMTDTFPRRSSASVTWPACWRSCRLSSVSRPSARSSRCSWPAIEWP